MVDPMKVLEWLKPDPRWGLPALGVAGGAAVGAALLCSHLPAEVTGIVAVFVSVAALGFSGALFRWIVAYRDVQKRKAADEETAEQREAAEAAAREARIEQLMHEVDALPRTLIESVRRSKSENGVYTIDAHAGNELIRRGLAELVTLMTDSPRFKVRLIPEASAALARWIEKKAGAETPAEQD